MTFTHTIMTANYLMGSALTCFRPSVMGLTMNVVTYGQIPASSTPITRGVYHYSILEVLTFYKSGLASYCLSKSSYSTSYLEQATLWKKKSIVSSMRYSA
jgi:hypothetical protein